jgi:uncharacterized delta-60 repeat protein
VQADGKILVGGAFTTLGGQSRNTIGRLNVDGTLDTSFNPGAEVGVLSLAVQADGKILVGGGFTTLGGQSRANIGRLNADGTLDTSFNPGADNTVDSLALQADGKILAGGYFTTLGGQSRNNIGRLNNTGPATQSLTFDGSTLTWMRGGTSPEVWRTTFEYSPDGGTVWTSLGAGIRIPGLSAGQAGGWQLSGVALSAYTTFRARGYTVGGYGNGSGWLVETVTLVINGQPASRTNNAGTTAAFSVDAIGSGPLTYQWRKDGAKLADGGNVSGAATASLTLSNVLGGAAGAYSVVITDAAGRVTSVVARLTVIDPVINIQPAGQAANAGDSVTLSVVAAGTAPLSYQWRKDGGLLAGATQSSLAFTKLQGSDAGSYDVVVSSVWGSVTSAVALLSVNLALPDSFNPGANYLVYSLAVQADGKILVGGNFTTLGGQSRNGVGRLNADGTLDTTFIPGTDGFVYTLAVQADGKIVVGGTFTTLGGQIRNKIGRLNADGTLDTSFNPGANNTVDSLAVQADGKILVGGAFTTLGSQSRTNIGRLNADGMLDPSFNPGADSYVNSLALQADGQILVGGFFGLLGGQSRNYTGRLKADGTLDTSFNPGISGAVSSLALQADGKILVAGNFTTLGGQSRNYIGRLNADGTLDTSFNPGADGFVFSLVVQVDGKILVGGFFRLLGGQSRSYIGRLNADGTLDPSFNPGADNAVFTLALQADGKILVGGGFGTLGGQSHNYIGRLSNTGPATQSLTYDGSTLTWTRGGTSPEVWRTTFEYSPDGASWTNLGAGSRIPGLPAGQAGGWQLTGLALPTDTMFRARGYTVGGLNDASGWFVETVTGFRLTVVNTNNDGPGSLRQAVLDANPLAGTNIIQFAPSAYGTITLTSGELFITDNLFIKGPGATNVVVDGNHASRVFHISSGRTVTISGLTITNGHATGVWFPDGAGGGIWNDHAALTVSNCTLSGNSAVFAGGIYNDGTYSSASLRIVNSTLSGNSAPIGSGGGILNDGFFGGSATLIVSNCLLIGNAASSGGGMCNDNGVLTVSWCTLSGNSASEGGGLFSAGSEGHSATLTVANSTLSGNSAHFSGGGIFNDGFNGGFFGGSATLIVSNCLLIGNAASSGGGMYNDNGVLTVSCSTLSGNGGYQGGGIFSAGSEGHSTTLTVANSTLSGNWAVFNGGILNDGTTLEIGSTILNRGASGDNIVNDSGTVTSLGYNLSSDDGGGFLTATGDQINTDPKLGPLQDNGGPTFTHAPACNSPAIDHGKNFSAAATDQRGAGFARTFDGLIVPNAPGGDGTDIGAIELQAVCDHPPVADASATLLLLIAANGTNATVILDGSRSSDPDGDVLQYAWFEAGSPLASGVVAVTVLPLGAHSILLVVNDGLLTDTNAITVEVLTTAQAVAQLVASVNSDVSRSAPLRAALAAAIASIDRSNPTAAINQLQAFQNQLRAQVAPLDAALADTFIQAAQQAIDALSGGNTNPGGQPQGRFTSLTRQPGGRTQLQFSGEAGRRYIIEASANLIDWEMIGVAAGEADGSFAFEDAQSARFISRFYRILAP